MDDNKSALARSWIERAQVIERHIAEEYDPSEQSLPEVHMLEVEAETLLRCASELYSRLRTDAPAEEEIKF